MPTGNEDSTALMSGEDLPPPYVGPDNLPESQEQVAASTATSSSNAERVPHFIQLDYYEPGKITATGNRDFGKLIDTRNIPIMLSSSMRYEDLCRLLWKSSDRLFGIVTSNNVMESINTLVDRRRVSIVDDQTWEAGYTILQRNPGATLVYSFLVALEDVGPRSKDSAQPTDNAQTSSKAQPGCEAQLGSEAQPAIEAKPRSDA